MSIAHLLDDVDAARDGHTVTLTDAALAEERLAAFESGYRAGWDDAVKAQTGVCAVPAPLISAVSRRCPNGEFRSEHSEGDEDGGWRRRV